MITVLVVRVYDWKKLDILELSTYVHLIVYEVHIFWEGHEFLLNLHLTFDWHCMGQK